MRVKKTNFVVVYLHDDWGLTEQTAPVLFDLVDSAQSKRWDFWNPGSVIAYFIANHKGMELAEKLFQQVKKLIEEDSRFSDLGVGKAVGELIAEFDWRGRLKSEPIGAAIGIAAKMAREKRLGRLR